MVSEDIAIILSKSDFDHRRNFRVIKATKHMWIHEHGYWRDAHEKEGIITQSIAPMGFQ